jgi:argininosuccinate synthase
MEKERCILAYSGGLDTSALVPYMQEKFGYEIVCALVNVGRMKDLESLRMRGITAGAIESIVIDAEEEFLTDYAFEALKANALYEGKYPLHSALSRPLISAKMVELAHEWGAKYIAHGCTAKGNDQVRMDVSIRCLDPDITVLGPAREWGMTRPQLLDYLAERGIDLPLTKKNPYSIDENLWGRAIEFVF